ncbi:hypothetical protein BDZ45DRAFT_749439 [Acephala macrosclerotiorum]|nr:hypothetical protein BDZ45DRAFT_749439 [Acephala macrosclerotiorum]
MNRNDARDPSPRRLSTLVEVTEPNESVHDPDRCSILTFATNPYARTDSPSPKSVVYVGESAKVIQVTRRNKFKRYKNKIWFWPSILAAVTLIILVLVATVLLFVNYAHRDKSTEMVDHEVYTTTMTIAAASAVQEACTSGPCGMPSESTSTTLSRMTVATSGVVAIQPCTTCNPSAQATSTTNIPPPVVPMTRECAEGPCGISSELTSTATTVLTVPSTDSSAAAAITTTLSGSISTRGESTQPTSSPGPSRPIQVSIPSITSIPTTFLTDTTSTSEAYTYTQQTGTPSMFQGKAATILREKMLLGIMSCWVVVYLPRAL